MEGNDGIPLRLPIEHRRGLDPQEPQVGSGAGTIGAGGGKGGGGG